MEKKRNDTVFSEPYSTTQYGMHVGCDAQMYQKMNAPHSTLGKPKGDRNRASKGNQVGVDYYDQL